MGKVIHVWGEGLYGKPLYLLLSVAVNLILSKICHVSIHIYMLTCTPSQSIIVLHNENIWQTLSPDSAS